MNDASARLESNCSGLSILLDAVGTVPVLRPYVVQQVASQQTPAVIPVNNFPSKARVPVNLDPVEVTRELVSCASVTTSSNEPVTDIMRRHLEALGFFTHLLVYTDLNGTRKVALEAKRPPTSQNAGRGIGYFCHNDVVSVDGWDCRRGGPFDAEIADEKLWGRGACDMKGSAACALAALSSIDPARQTAPIYFFVTGDEECGMAGADVLARGSELFMEMVQSQSFGIIGEPTDLQVVHAHKGGCHITVTALGIAAHSSTADGVNANWKMIPFLSYLRELAERSESDPELKNVAFTPPTISLNLVIDNKPNSSNITVGESSCTIFFRPMPDVPWEGLRSEMMATAADMDLTVRSFRPLPPLATRRDSEFLREALALLGQAEPFAVSYATDGCCFQALEHLIVIGPGSIEQAHRPDEWIALDQLRRGTEVFRRMFMRFACNE